MSLLNKPAPVTPTPCMIASKLKAQARNTYGSLARLFNEGSKEFWQNSHATPEAIASCLGKDGAELFRLHGLIGQLLTQIDPTSISEGAAVVGSFSYAQDGSLVIHKASSSSSM